VSGRQPGASADVPAPDPGNPRAAAILMDLTLSALEREARDSWETIAACLQGRAVLLALGDWEAFVLTSAHGRPLVRSTEVEPASALRANRVALHSLAGGTASVIDLVTDGHASMRGPRAELARLSELPSALIEGIIRSPAAQELWDRFLHEAGGLGPTQNAVGRPAPVNSSGRT
jgi:hypothetical protein